MPYKDRDQQRAYQREYLKSRRDEWVSENGPCAICGATDNLEVDHVNPGSKSVPVGQIWSRREKVRLAELAKCQVLCRSCHVEKNRSERHTYRKASMTTVRSLTDEEADMVKELIASGYQPAEIARMTGVKRQTVKNIKRGQCYA